MKKLLTYSQIASALKKPPATVHRWLNGVRGISADMASALENVTGVKAEAWVFPDKYKNPYLKHLKSKDELLFPELYSDTETKAQDSVL